MMSGEEGGFPGGAFVALAVTQQAEDPMGGGPEHGRISHPRGDGEPMAQRASGHVDAGQCMRHVPAKIRAILVMSQEFLDREKAALRKRGVESGSSVAFAENEAIASGTLGCGRINA